MKFLRELIARKHQDADPSAVSDAALNAAAREPEETSDGELFSNLASIQSKIQEAVNGSKRGSGKLAKEGEYNDQVQNFADAVADTIDPVTERPELDQEGELLATAGDEDETEHADEHPEEDAAQQDNNLTAPDADESGSSDTDADTHSDSTAKIFAMPKATDGMATEHKVAPPNTSAEVGASVTVVASETEQVPETSIPGVQAEPDLECKPNTETVELKPSPAPNIVHVPAPAAGRAGRRAGRVKTRLLGFEHSHGANSDPFDVSTDVASEAQVKFPVGWIVVVSGPGRGNTFALFNGVAQIGRGEDQAIKLDFGDTSISRSNHAAIAYDNEQRTFFLGHGGKANLVRLNDNPVLSTEEISSSDLIRIGETTLRFVGLCGTDFDWGSDDRVELDNAATA